MKRKYGPVARGFWFSKGVAGSAILALALTACTEPRETTGIGAAAGGVLGAGLGAIIGSQTGDPGAGVIIGGLSGAAAGGGIGNALQAQEERSQGQEEELRRQNELIRAQSGEIDALRSAQDGGISPGARGMLGRSGSAASIARYDGIELKVPPGLVEPRSSRRGNSAAMHGRDQSRGIGAWRESALGSSLGSGEDFRTGEVPRFAGSSKLADGDIPPVRYDERSEQLTRDLHAAAEAGFGARANGGNIEGSPSAPLESRDIEPVPMVAEFESPSSTESGSTVAAYTPPGGPECEEAQREIEKGDLASELPDKLFHVRRALRLCPTHAEYHAQLGSIYLKLDREEDALFEFREAFRLNPALDEARREVARLEQGGARSRF